MSILNRAQDREINYRMILFTSKEKDIIYFKSWSRKTRSWTVVEDSSCLMQEIVFLIGFPDIQTIYWDSSKRVMHRNTVKSLFIKTDRKGEEKTKKRKVCVIDLCGGCFICCGWWILNSSGHPTPRGDNHIQEIFARRSSCPFWPHLRVVSKNT